MIDNLLLNLRYAISSLSRAPGFTLTVVLTLALGIGAGPGPGLAFCPRE